MKANKKKEIVKKIFGVNILVIILIIMVIGLSITTFKTIQTLRHNGVLSKHRNVNELLMKNKKANKISITDVGIINTWMTFEYINFIFDIPDNYIKDKLQIENNKYPKLTLLKYIKDKKIDKNEFLIKIKNTIIDYKKLQPIKK